MEYLPTDFEIKSTVYSMWRKGLNLEVHNISACLYSDLACKRKLQHGVASDEFKAHVHTRLKAMVKAGDLRRQRFLPGRPFYTIG